jgi:hypothetical protein
MDNCLHCIRLIHDSDVEAQGMEESIALRGDFGAMSCTSAHAREQTLTAV